MNTRDVDFTDEKNLEKYIHGILSLEENWDYIYIEQFNLKLYKYIESKLNLKFKKGKNIRLYNIVMILNEILKYKKEKHKEEILILCEDLDLSYELISFISHDFKFISLIGVTEDDFEDLYDKIFKYTGISIFQPKDIKTNLKNIKIVINLKEELNEELMDKLKNMNKKTIFIDFSLSKPLLVLGDIDIITDVVFDISEEIFMNNILINREIKSILYESLFGDKIRKFSKLLINEKELKEYKKIDVIKIRGTL